MTRSIPNDLTASQIYTTRYIDKIFIKIFFNVFFTKILTLMFRQEYLLKALYKDYVTLKDYDLYISVLLFFVFLILVFIIL